MKREKFEEAQEIVKEIKRIEDCIGTSQVFLNDSENYLDISIVVNNNFSDERTIAKITKKDLEALMDYWERMEIELDDKFSEL